MCCIIIELKWNKTGDVYNNTHYCLYLASSLTMVKLHTVYKLVVIKQYLSLFLPKNADEMKNDSNMGVFYFYILQRPNTKITLASLFTVAIMTDISQTHTLCLTNGNVNTD